MEKAKKCRRIKPSDVGRWITVRWADVGREDALLVKFDADDKRPTIYSPTDEGTAMLDDLDQVVEIRGYVVPA